MNSLKFLLFSFILTATAGLAQNPGVAIDEQNMPADPSAMLDVKSDSRGALLPRVASSAFSDTTTAMGTNPALSLTAFDSTRLGYFFFNGSDWERLMSSATEGGRILGTTPTSSTDPLGSTGDMAFDSNYFYIKTAAGWRRLSLGTF